MRMRDLRMRDVVSPDVLGDRDGMRDARWRGYR
jgi:hypothetical protein